MNLQNIQVTLTMVGENLQNLEMEIESKCLMFYCLCPSSKHFFTFTVKAMLTNFKLFFPRKLSTTNTIFRNTNTRHRCLWTSPSAPQYIFHIFDIFNENSNTENIFTCYFPSSCCNLEVFNTNGEIKRRTTFCEVQWEIKKALLERKVSRKVNR